MAGFRESVKTGGIHKRLCCKAKPTQFVEVSYSLDIRPHTDTTSKATAYLDLGQKISDGAPEEEGTNGKGLPDSASMSLIETKEDAKEINPLMEHPTSQADSGSSRERGKQKPARNSVSSSESARARSPQIIAESLLLDQPGWSADYSLPTGNPSEEAPQ